LAVSFAAVFPAEAMTRATDYPGSVSLLLESRSVRRELDLSRSQIERLQGLRRRLKSECQSILDSPAGTAGLTVDQRLFGLIDRNNAAALACLNPDQFQQFHRIQNRLLGCLMLVSPQVQKQLRLTPRQVAGVEKIRLRGLEFVAEVNRSFDHGDLSRSRRATILRDYRMAQAREFEQILTARQKAVFNQLAGLP
jgi:hypothetical protein